MAQLNNILAALKQVGGSGLEKTAAVVPPAEKTSAAEQDLVNALNTALAGTAEKTAAENTSATSELLKVAGDLATADREGLIKEAELFGGAFADGCMSRLAQYDAAPLAGEKTASAGISNEEFEKWASENPAEFKENFEAGYKEAAAELQKQANTPEAVETVAQLTKLAETPEGREKIASFDQGYEDTVAQLEKIASEPEGQEKIAALRAGYAHGSEMVEKLAADTYTQGYNDTVVLLQNM